MGYTVDRTPASGDQGVDLILRCESKTSIAIQAKRYNEPVGNAAIQEVFAGRVFYSATRAAVVTTSTYSRAAVDLALRTRVRLVARDELFEWLTSFPLRPLGE